MTEVDPDDEWHSWIDMETIRDPMSPWLLIGVVWCLLIGALTVALLLRW